MRKTVDEAYKAVLHNFANGAPGFDKRVGSIGEQIFESQRVMEAYKLWLIKATSDLPMALLGAFMDGLIVGMEMENEGDEKVQVQVEGILFMEQEPDDPPSAKGKAS